MEIGLPEVKSEVFEHEDGMLYIADPWEKEFHQPVVRRRVWATGLYARDCPSLIGQGVRRLTNGTYMTDSGARVPVTGQSYELSECRGCSKEADK